MKLTIHKDQLIAGLQAVQNVVNARTTLPILYNVLVRAEGDRVSFTGTDLDVTITATVQATVETAGATTLPAKRLFSLVRELPAGELEIEVDAKHYCAIRAGASFYKIHGLPAEDFPPLPNLAESRRIELPQEKFRALLKKTSYAISTDETRHVLNGIYISLREHKLALVATDGRRLALSDEDIDIPEGAEGDCIVPTKAINELSRLLQPGGTLEVKIGSNQIAFTLNDDKNLPIVIISKLVEGTYPNYRQVIPAEPKVRIALSREELLSALRRAELMTSDKNNSVKLLFVNNTLTITANTPDVGEGREMLAVKYDGAEVAIAFNPIYLMDPLKALDNDEVYLELIDELSPGMVKINGPFLYVLMPMRMS